MRYLLLFVGCAVCNCVTMAGNVDYRYLIIDLSEGSDALFYDVRHVNDKPSRGWCDDYKTVKLVMRRIPSGVFAMGSLKGEMGREPFQVDNEIRREVEINKPFYIGVFPVTQRQWELVTGDRPSHFRNDDFYQMRPVERVSYFDIRGESANWPISGHVEDDSFLGKLRARTGLMLLDLPTEAQWEYACRAGTQTELNNGKNLTSDTGYCRHLAEVARYWSNGGADHKKNGDLSVGTAKVGSYLPNAWSLHDMHGNVQEWCLDWHESRHAATQDPAGAISGTYRVLRGGSWDGINRNCRSAARNIARPSERSSSHGLRVVMMVQDGKQRSSMSHSSKACCASITLRGVGSRLQITNNMIIPDAPGGNER